MKYGDIKREVLSHINQYSMRGAQVPLSYNCQEDYENRIPHLINEALVNIRTLVKKLPRVFTPENGERVGDLIRYDLPKDFYALKTGGIAKVEDGKFRSTNQYRIQGRRFLLLPSDAAGQYSVEYYAYPVQLPLDCPDDLEIEEDLEVIQTATYYAAAALVRLEDEFAYSTLYNDYESRLERISSGVAIEVAPVEDVYGLAGGYV